MNIKEKLASSLGAIIVTPIFVIAFYAAVLYLMNYETLEAVQADAGRVEVAEGIVTLPDMTEAYNANQITLYNVSANVIELSAVKATEPATEPEVEARYNLTDEEKEMIAVIAWREDHTNVESMMCVTQVIMNRVESGKFADSVRDVIYQDKPVQFPTRRYIGVDTVDETALEAVERVCGGEDPFEGELAIFFNNANVQAHKIARGLYLVRECGGSKFYGQE